MPLVEQELLTLPEHLISPSVFSGVRVTRSLVLCVCFVDRCLSFCTFVHLAIALSVLPRYTDSDYLPWYLQTLLTHIVKSSKNTIHVHTCSIVDLGEISNITIFVYHLITAILFTNSQKV